MKLFLAIIWSVVSVGTTLTIGTILMAYDQYLVLIIFLILMYVVIDQGLKRIDGI
jgi:hypothetical protein